MIASPQPSAEMRMWISPGLSVLRTTMLSVNGHAHAVLVIPYARFITRESAEAVIKLADRGGKVLFIDAYPDGLCTGEVLPEGGEYHIYDAWHDRALAWDVGALSVEPYHSLFLVKGAAENVYMFQLRYLLSPFLTCFG